MSERLRRLNDEGVRLFGEYLADGAAGDPPLSLLDNPETSDALPFAVVPGTAQFSDRYEFGVYLKSLLAPFDPAVIANDRNFWSSLALIWFNRLCPPQKSDTARAVGEEYRYILSDDYRHYHRHLVRSPWQLVRLHGKYAQLLLVAPRKQDYPLSIHGEILEQFAGRQQVLASCPIIEAAFKMYFDPATSRPRMGVAGSGRGSARRFAMVLRQLGLTYDAEAMPDGVLLGILPAEFEKWKPKAEQALKSSGAVNSGIHAGEPLKTGT